jgi:hypothetical protein
MSTSAWSAHGASAAGSAPAAAVQHSGTARSASPHSASVTGPGSVGVRLLDVPANAVTNPRARAYIVDNLAPGTTIHRRIEVSNTTTSAQQVAVYPAAAAITNGSFVGAAARTANDLSTWTTVSRPTLDVPAGATAVDTVTVAIPSTASPGERYAAVWASVAPGQSEPVWFVLTSQMTDGPWNATVTLHSGLTRQAFRAQITFPRNARAAPPAPAHRSSGGLNLVMILASAILIALLTALVALIITYRRRRLHKNRLGAYQGP